MRTLTIGLLIGLTSLSTQVYAEPANVASAVAATADRTEANVKLDEGRKPADVLAFLGLEQGMHVLDPFGANLYWAELTAPAVGPTGHVTIWNPNQFMGPETAKNVADFVSRHPNSLFLHSPMESPLFGAGLYDFALVNLDYHDVYWTSDKYKIVRMDPASWTGALFRALKPGAVLGIVDHVANPGGNTREVVDKLHRIDPAVVKADFERAGFVLEAESDLLRNPADSHEALVFDPSIRGKTDRFIFKFRKP